MTGKVYLVGGGPGDPGLITVKGLDCLSKADCVIYDRLASRRLLSYARNDAELLNVRRPSDEGEKGPSQQEIIDLMASKAREGKTVVRLKGGDPFIFGRGGEEALGLAEEGIPFEIVPGVSSFYSVPAYAGIPITFRGLSSTAGILTGHEDLSKERSDIQWDKLATGVGTLVILMAMKNLPWVCSKLIEFGRSKDTPACVIRWGTTADQETVAGTLENLAKKASEAKFTAPAVVIIGEVVGLRDRLAWYERTPLFGKRIVITRPKAQAEDFIQKLTALGAEAIAVPTIKTVPPESYEALDKAILDLSRNRYNWLIFTSANGVKYFMARLKELKQDVRILHGVRLAAIGPATARSLSKFNLLVDFLPEEYVAEGVIEGFLKMRVKGQRVLIPRAKVARDTLPDTLRASGATVDIVEAYETIAEANLPPGVGQILYNGQVDIVTFTSSSTVRNFVSLMDGQLERVLSNASVVAIGPVTADTAGELGIKVDVVAAEYTVPGLVKAIVEHYGKKPKGGN